MSEIVDTFSSLYIDSEDETEKPVQHMLMPERAGDSEDFIEVLPPSPLVFEEEQEDFNGITTTQV